MGKRRECQIMLADPRTGHLARCQVSLTGHTASVSAPHISMGSTPGYYLASRTRLDRAALRWLEMHPSALLAIRATAVDQR